MLPWESLPELRYEEVYHMPSVAAILYTYDRSCHYREEVGKKFVDFPIIDPLDAYYLLNPGTPWTSPPVKELDEALQKHELFIYFGHENGSDHIPRNVIQKPDKCAAIFLMGCRSGTISFKAHYCPRGAPLDFLSRGSPLVVANLWAVDGDIGYFSKSLLDECI